MESQQSNIKPTPAPHFRLNQPPRSIMLSQLWALLFMLIPPLFIYGFRTIIMAAMGVCGAVAVEAAWRFFSHKEQTVGDLSAVCCGIICACLLPASAPVWLPMLAGMFSAAVCKLPFGTLGRSPFSPAAGGYCFAAAVCATVRNSIESIKLSFADRAIWQKLAERFFEYTKIAGGDGRALPLVGNCSPSGALSFDERLQAVDLLRADVDPGLSLSEFFLAQMRGPMGTTAILLIIAAGIWLFFRRACAWQASVGFCAAAAVFSFFVPYNPIIRVMSPVYDLLTGSTLFVAVFLVGDLFTAPHMRTGRVIYGAACGILAMFLRRTGAVPGSEVFAVLLMNAAAPYIDRLVWYCRGRGISYTETKRRIAASLKERMRKKEEEEEDAGDEI